MSVERDYSVCVSVVGVPQEEEVGVPAVAGD